MSEFLIYMTLFVAAVGYPVWTSYFGNVSGDHVNGVPALVYVEDHKRWIEDQKRQRREAIRAAIST